MTIPDGATITREKVQKAMEGGQGVSSIALSLDANVESGAFSGLSDITIRVSPGTSGALNDDSILGGAADVTLDLSQCVGLTIGGTALAGNGDLKEVIFPSGVVIQDMPSMLQTPPAPFSDVPAWRRSPSATLQCGVVCICGLHQPVGCGEYG